MVALSADTSPCNVASIFSCCVSFCMSAPLGDGCVRTPSYVRERAGTHSHHSSPRRQRGMRFESPLSISLVCVACPRSSSEPLCQAISTVDVLKTRVRKPVVGSMFVDSAVRVEWWNGRVSGAAVNSEGRDVFMPSIVFFRPFAVIPRRSQLLGRPANAATLGVNHG
jgi:hypothetical protein